MISQNPYSLPDRVIRQQASFNQNHPKPIISLQNKKSRQRSQQYSSLSSRGIKLQSSAIKNSRQHQNQRSLKQTPSSPNLHSKTGGYNNSGHSESYSQEKRLFSQYEDKKLKYVTEKLMVMSQMLNSHEIAIKRLQHSQMKDSQQLTSDSSDVNNSHSGIGSFSSQSFNSTYSNNSGKSIDKTMSSLTEAIDTANREIRTLKHEVNTIKSVSFGGNYEGTQKMKIKQGNSSRQSDNHQTKSEKHFRLEGSSNKPKQIGDCDLQDWKLATTKIAKFEESGQIMHRSCMRAHEKIDSLQQSVERRIEQVSADFKLTLSTMVQSINQRIASALLSTNDFIFEKLEFSQKNLKMAIIEQLRQAQETAANGQKINPEVNCTSKALSTSSPVAPFSLRKSGFKSVAQSMQFRHKAVLTPIEAENKNSTDPSKQPSKELEVSNCIYFIDEEGFLLDEQGYYLLDSEEKLIRLQEEELTVVKRAGIF